MDVCSERLLWGLQPSLCVCKEDLVKMHIKPIIPLLRQITKLWHFCFWIRKKKAVCFWYVFITWLLENCQEVENAEVLMFNCKCTMALISPDIGCMGSVGVSMDTASAKTLPSEVLLSNLVQGKTRESSFKTCKFYKTNTTNTFHSRCLPANGACGPVSRGAGTSLRAGARN